MGLKTSKSLLILVVTNTLTACISSHKEVSKPLTSNTKPLLVCSSAGRYANSIIGDGHCVSLIKHCTNAPHTSAWRPGPPVLQSQIPAGTVIATFDKGRYPNKSGYHAAIYIKHDQNGIWVWDQWQGKAVHKRLIRVRHDQAKPGNTAQSYRVVSLK